MTQIVDNITVQPHENAKITSLIPPGVQVRAGLEKAKLALEKESADLSADLRSLVSSKQDVEHKKKKLEGQLNDLHSRFNESERQRTELSERISKMTVSLQLVASVMPPFLFPCVSVRRAVQEGTLDFFFHLCQVELDSVTGLLNEAEGKNIKLSKDVSTLNSQLQDAQVTQTS